MASEKQLSHGLPVTCQTNANMLSTMTMNLSLNTTAVVYQKDLFLGPLLFLLYIDELPAVFKLFMPISFANDTNLFFRSRNVNMLVDDINTELVNVYA